MRSVGGECPFYIESGHHGEARRTGDTVSIPLTLNSRPSSASSVREASSVGQPQTMASAKRTLGLNRALRAPDQRSSRCQSSTCNVGPRRCRIGRPARSRWGGGFGLRTMATGRRSVPVGSQVSPSSTHADREASRGTGPVPTPARPVTGWRCPLRFQPAPGTAADTVRIQPGHRLPEGLQALAGGHTRQPGRDANAEGLARWELQAVPHSATAARLAYLWALPARCRFRRRRGGCVLPGFAGRDGG